MFQMGWLKPPTSKPISSMYGIFTYTYHENQSNVGMDGMGNTMFYPFQTTVAHGGSPKVPVRFPFLRLAVQGAFFGMSVPGWGTIF